MDSKIIEEISDYPLERFYNDSESLARLKESPLHKILNKISTEEKDAPTTIHQGN